MTTRRSFLRTMSMLTPALMVPWKSYGGQGAGVLPLRQLGASGEKVTMLGTGGYHVGWTSERDAQEVIETSFAEGVRFFDSAYSYSDGTSERRYGKYLLPKHREEVFVMTKSTAKDYRSARAELEESLRRLGIDQVDLWQIHSLQSPEDTDARIQNGVLRLAEEALSEGKARYIGFTGHRDPYAHLRMLEQAGDSGLFTTIQMPINLVDAASEHSFVMKVLPRALEAKLAVLAMKTLADGRFFARKEVMGDQIWTTEDPVVPERVSLQEAIHFAWSLPISVLITGAENARLMREKATLARMFAQQSEDHRRDMSDRLHAIADAGAVEYYKQVEGR